MIVSRGNNVIYAAERELEQFIVNLIELIQLIILQWFYSYLKYVAIIPYWGVWNLPVGIDSAAHFPCLARHNQMQSLRFGTSAFGWLLCIVQCDHCIDGVHRSSFDWDGVHRSSFGWDGVMARLSVGTAFIARLLFCFRHSVLRLSRDGVHRSSLFDWILRSSLDLFRFRLGVLALFARALVDVVIS